MTALERFRRSIDDIESGPLDYDACRRLVREICAYQWNGDDERNAAQGLVNRLARLARKGRDAWPSRPGASS